MARIVIFGAGDVARLAHFYFTREGEHEVAAFAVDAPFRTADEFLGLPLVDAETLRETYPPNHYDAFVAMGYAKMNRMRAEKYAALKAAGYRLVSYVSPRCTYLSDHRPGDNCFILEDNTIQPFVTIGNNVTLWSGNHIGHDASIDDHCFIASHVVISGHVKVGEACFIGVNATIRNGITIGPATLIGAGAVIMKNTRAKSVYLGHRAEVFAKTSDVIEP